jgi:hypothetical protein
LHYGDDGTRFADTHHRDQDYAMRSKEQKHSINVTQK